MSRLFRVRADAVEWRELDGEIVALDLRTSTYLAVNRTGAVLWPALTAGASHTDLVDLVVDAFPVARPTAEQGVDAFLDELRRQDLLEG